MRGFEKKFIFDVTKWRVVRIIDANRLKNVAKICPKTSGEIDKKRPQRKRQLEHKTNPKTGCISGEKQRREQKRKQRRNLGKKRQKVWRKSATRQ